MASPRRESPAARPMSQPAAREETGMTPGARAADTAEPEDTGAGFLIDGKEYPIPGLESFDMDEAQVLYDYSSLTLEDFSQPDPDDPDSDEVLAERSQRMKNPALIRALLHVAYQRGNPTVKPVHVRRLVGGVNLLDTALRLVKQSEGEDGDASPPESDGTSEPVESSPRSSDDTNESSGNGSESGSDAPAYTPEPTGTTKSPTSHTLAEAKPAP